MIEMLIPFLEAKLQLGRPAVAGWHSRESARINAKGGLSSERRTLKDF